VFTASAFWVVSTVAALPGLWVFWQQGMPPGRDDEEENAAQDSLKSS